MGVSIYFLVNTIKEYLKYEVTTVVRSINEEEMDFPIITVCFTNKVVNKKGYDYFVSILNEYSTDVNEYLNYIKIDHQHDFDSYSYYIERVKDSIDNSIPVYYYYNMPINERYNLLDKDIRIINI